MSGGLWGRAQRGTGRYRYCFVQGINLWLNENGRKFYSSPDVSDGSDRGEDGSRIDSITVIAWRMKTGKPLSMDGNHVAG